MDEPDAAASGKKGDRDEAHIVLLDECGCLLAPLARRSYAPRGQTPILDQHGGHRRKVSVMAAMALSPKLRLPSLYFQTLIDSGFDGERTLEFVRQLLHHLRGNVLMIWDNAPHHRAHLVRNGLARYDRLTVEYLPPYAPELNPTEFGWAWLKWCELANVAPPDVHALHAMVIDKMSRLALRRDLMRNFYRATPLAAAFGI